MAKEHTTEVDEDRATTEVAATEIAPTEAGRGEDPSRTLPLNAPTEIRQAVGRFRIVEWLGSGGMADVYRAYDPVLDRAVALKVLHTKRIPGDTQGMRRVLREARAAAALTHPNTVTIFEVGEAEGDVFIAMELLQGIVLRRVLEGGRATLPEKLRWLLQAAQALAAAHERGLVHRDVKPDNMFVCADGTLKLLDFGIAKRDGDDTTDTGADPVGPSSLRTEEGRRVGTPRYMAPEQHAGHGTDARTDLYAWGLVAFELLTGTHPVVGQATMTMDPASTGVATTATARREALRAHVPDLPESVAVAIGRALEVRKEDRFSSMLPVIAALGSTEPGALPKTGTRTPTWKIAALVIIVLGVSASGIAIGRWRAAQLALAAGAEPKQPVLKPLCRTVSARSVPLGEADRVAVLPDGSLVFARNIRGGMKLEHETPQGTVRYAPKLPTMLPPDFIDLKLAGVTFRGKPAVFVHLEVDRVRGSTLQAWLENGEGSMSRLVGNSSEIVATPFGDAVVVIASRTLGDTSPGVVATRVGDPRISAIEDGEVGYPAVAASGDRLGVVYRSEQETHFALLDRDIERIGDVKTVTSYPVRAAVAFAGPSAVVFWGNIQSAKTRLTYSTFTPGDPGLSAPKVAIDEPLAHRAPITARLPDDRFAVGWTTSNGGPVTLRVSPVGAGGALAGPSNVATEAAFEELKVTATTQGVDFTWRESATTMKIARVACTPAP